MRKEDWKLLLWLAVVLVIGWAYKPTTYPITTTGAVTKSTGKVVESVMYTEPTEPVATNLTEGILKEGNFKKFLFEDFQEGGGYVYSINNKTFGIAQNAGAKAECLLYCTVDQECKPVAITKTGNYIILENQKGERIAARLKKSQTPLTLVMGIDKLPKIETEVFRLVEA